MPTKAAVWCGVVVRALPGLVVHPVVEGGPPTEWFARRCHDSHQWAVLSEVVHDGGLVLGVVEVHVADEVKVLTRPDVAP